MRIGYARVSTKEQNTYRQEILLKELQVDKVYIDKCSGKNTDRPMLKEMMAFAREEDVIVVESISRLARNTRDLLEIVDKLKKSNIGFKSIKEGVDTKTPTGAFMLTIFGAVAELEREYILERQKEGIRIAREQGKYKGRKKIHIENFEEVYGLWRDKTITTKRAQELLGVKVSTFYRRVKEYEQGLKKK